MQYTLALKLLMGLVAITHYREIMVILNLPLDLKDDMDRRKKEEKEQ